MTLCLYRLPCAALLLWLLVPAVVQAQKDPGGPGQIPQNQGELLRDPDGPGQGDQGPTLARRADLALLPELRLGGQATRWGGRVQLQAASALRSTDGRCVFALQFEVVNGGLIGSAATTHRLVQTRNPPIQLTQPRQRAAAQVIDQTALAPSERQGFRRQLELEPGSSWLELTLDAAERVTESIEANNRRRVQVEIDGRCG
jgi:hypothetical protein